jgi:hypothetical protein
MPLLAAVAFFQFALPARQIAPVLAFPDPTLDDTAAYQGYHTRFFKDVAGNTIQIYADGRSGRVVHLLADAEDESIGFSIRDQRGTPATVRWANARAEVSGS